MEQNQERTSIFNPEKHQELQGQKIIANEKPEGEQSEAMGRDPEHYRQIQKTKEEVSRRADKVRGINPAVRSVKKKKLQMNDLIQEEFAEEITAIQEGHKQNQVTGFRKVLKFAGLYKAKAISDEETSNIALHQYQQFAEQSAEEGTRFHSIVKKQFEVKRDACREYDQLTNDLALSIGEHEDYQKSLAKSLKQCSQDIRKYSTSENRSSPEIKALKSAAQTEYNNLIKEKDKVEDDLRGLRYDFTAVASQREDKRAAMVNAQADLTQIEKYRLFTTQSAEKAKYVISNNGEQEGTLEMAETIAKKGTKLGKGANLEGITRTALNDAIEDLAPDGLEGMLGSSEESKGIIAAQERTYDSLMEQVKQEMYAE